jgi:hypothetical protein
MFMSQAEAVALFPGGFGTMDEAYEALTLVQTGKTSMIPIVMVEGEGGDYWKQWERWTRSALLDRGLISPEDVHLYYVASSAADAAEHVTRFYRNFHSSRYVKDEFVIRLKAPLREEDVAGLAAEFAVLIKSGTIEQKSQVEGDDELPDLPRLVFRHTRHKFGLIRRLIDRINECDPVGSDVGAGPAPRT